MTYDASNRKDIRRAEKESRLAEVQRLDYLRAAMSVTQGRAWFHDLLEACHLFADPFTGDALLEAYSKGERNVGLRIFADLVAHCPDDYITMMKEANARRTLADTRARTAAELPGEPEPGWDDTGSVGSAIDDAGGYAN
jgi:hypothetical protein